MNWESKLPLLVEGVVDDGGDWDDVVERASRLVRAARRRRLAGAVAVLALAVFLVSPAFGLGSWYGALFGTVTRQPLVVRRTSGGCELLQNSRKVATIPCVRPQLAPTSEHPISDFSVYGRRSQEGRRILRLAGEAAPGVISVALLTLSGRLVDTTAVSDGFYARTSGLSNDPVEAVVGLDASGRPIACEPAAARNCPVHAAPGSKGG